jgi:hypothetical protein
MLIYYLYARTSHVSYPLLLLGGVWGTVCSYDWDFNDAEVACRQMGYPGVLNSLTSRLDAYGEFRGPIWWASVGCTGGELRLEVMWPSTLFLTCSYTLYIGLPERQLKCAHL